LQQINQDGKIFCLDIAKNMISLAKVKILDKRVKFIIGDIHSQKLKDLVFDSIICFNMFPHIDNKPIFLKRAYIRLKKGGQITICHDQTREKIISIHQQHAVSKNISEFPETQEILKIMIQSGFKPTCCQDKSFFFIQAIK
ncbi:MAG: UbiE/COQ5 methyltransferase, partial [uncultured bacterium]